MRWHADRLGVLRRVENIHFDVVCTGGDRLVEIHAVEDRAHEHRLRPERRMVERKLSLRVGLGIGDRLHPALELDEDHLNARARLAGSAISDGTVNRSRLRESKWAPNETHQYAKAREYSGHRAPRSASADRAPRGRRTCDSVT